MPFTKEFFAQIKHFIDNSVKKWRKTNCRMGNYAYFCRLNLMSWHAC